MQILITGASGLIGFGLCQSLLDKGLKVTAISRSQVPQRLDQFLEHPHFNLETGNIRERDFTDNLFRHHRFDIVFNLAVERTDTKEGEAAPRLDETRAYQTNFLGTMNLLEGAADSGVSGWVQSSTMNVYNFDNPVYVPVDEAHPTNPSNPNGMSMLLAENLCGYFCPLYDFDYVILRYPGVFGPGKERGVVYKFLEHCLSNKKEPLQAPRQRSSDFVYVTDIVKANLLTLDCLKQQSGWTFNIGSGVGTTIPELARKILTLTGSNVQIQEIAPEKPREFYFDITLARQKLNYEPGSLDEGLRQFIDYLLGARKV